MTKFRFDIPIILFISIVLILSFSKPRYVEISTKFLPTKETIDQVSVLTANVGNSNLVCRKFFWKLCIPEVEDNIGQNIRVLHPDIVVLQEILSNEMCTQNQRNKNTAICDLIKKSNKTQVERLLGESYTIVCDSNNHMQCIGVRTDFAHVLNCPLGEICFNGRTITKIESCNPNFTIFAISVETGSQNNFDVVNIHLNSRSDICREKMFLEMMDDNNNVIVNDNVLILGDFNIDLYKSNKNSRLVILDTLENGINNRPAIVHETLDSELRPMKTFQFGPYQATLDYIFSNFLIGETVALGRTQETLRLDGGWGMDHSALFGVYEIKNSP